MEMKKNLNNQVARCFLFEKSINNLLNLLCVKEPVPGDTHKECVKEPVPGDTKSVSRNLSPVTHRGHRIVYVGWEKICIKPGGGLPGVGEVVKWR